MSFNSEYLELRKKRKEREQKLLNEQTVKKQNITTQDEKKLDFFEKGAFEEGYQVGDITKTILGTAGDAGLSVVKGLSNLGEGLLDTVGYAAAGVADLLGKKGWADDIRMHTQDSYTDDMFYIPNEAVKDKSVFGRTSKAILEGMGQAAGIAATAGVGGAAGLGTKGVTALTSAVTGLSGFGSGTSEAYQSGATDEEAVTYGAISAASDVLTEMLFGGLGKGANAIGISKGLSSADDMLAKKVSNMFSSQIAKNLSEFGVKAGAEGVEEVLAGVMQSVGKKLTYMSEEDLKKILENENLLEQFVVGMASSGFMQAKDLHNANATKTDFITGTSQLSQNEQAVFDKVYNDRVAEATKGGKKLSGKEKSNIYNSVMNDIEKGYIGIDTIESVLGGETYKQYQSAVEKDNQMKELQKEYDTLYRMKNGEKSDEQADRQKALKQQLDEYKSTSNMSQLKEQLSNEVSEFAKNTKLNESYNEKARRSQAFEADLTQYDAKAQETVKRAIDSGILNNTNRTHEFVDLVAKLSADKGVLFDFTNNAKIKESGFAVEGKTINGYEQGGNIAVNIDSAKALNKVVGHEITHILEGTEFYTELANVVKQYATTKGEYDSKLQSITKLYEGIEDANIENELTADLIGEYLFTDSDFVNSLSAEQPTLFQKIFDEIKYLCKIATAGSKEARQLEKVKKTFAEAYKQKNNTATDDGVIKYSFNDTKTGMANDKLMPYNEELTSIIEQKGGYIIDSFEKLENVVNLAFDNPQQKATAYFGILSPDVLSNIEKSIPNLPQKLNGTLFKKGKDYSIAATFDSIRHIVDEKSLNRTDVLDYLDRLSDTIIDYDTVHFNYYVDDRGQKTNGVIFKKKFADGTLESFELVSNGQKSLKLQTIYMEKADYKKRKSAKTPLIQNVPAHTPEARVSRTSNNSISNPTENVKEKQLEIINKYNPAPNTYNTWVRSVDDIKTFEEALADDEIAEYDDFNPDFDRAMAEQAIEDGEITVYSSYPIKQGVFVSPSYMEAESYSGDGTVYSKRVPLDSVAWIDITQGQYADTKTDNTKISLSLSNTNDDLGPVRERNNVYGEDIKLQVDGPVREDVAPGKATAENTLPDDFAPTAEDINNQNTLVIDDAPIKEMQSAETTERSTHEDLVHQMSDIMDENYISLEEFKSRDSSVWKNVDYNDEQTKKNITREVHQNMVDDGVVVEIADDAKETVAESYPDLRSMKKKDRTPILKEAMNKLKSNLRTFLNGFKNQSFEFEVSGKVLEAKLYNTGINEVLEKITQDKAEMLYSTKEIFRNARYLYSTPDYDGDPNVYRWNYFYTPVKIGEDIVGVRIAVRDTATPQESQIYNWGIKKDTSLDGVGRGTNDRISHDVSSDVSTDIIPNDEQNVNENTPDYFLDSEDKKKVKSKRKALHENIIAGFKSKFNEKGFDLDEELKKGKRHGEIFHDDNTPQRIMEKTFGYKAGQILADLTVNKIAQNETEGIKWLNTITGKKGLLRALSKEYHIKPRSKESAAAQMYLEGFYVNESDEYVRYGDAELAADFPDRNVRENIRLLAKDPRVREFYDLSLNAINEARVRNAYDPIPRRDNYALHFRAMEDVFSRIGVPLNPNDIKAKDLPTDLNGVTVDLKPGQPYFASAKHRIGVKTTYDLLGGMERYANSAKNQIYHIDDIQNLRALRNYIADTFGQAKGLEGLDELTGKEGKERIELVYNGHLSNFAKWLNEEANHVAGKTALIDRAIPRKALQFLSNLNGMVGSNQVGFNFSSSLTNIIPVVQTFARTNKYDFAKAFSQTVLNTARRFSGNDDGFAEKSPVMIRRKGAESFAKTPYQKATDAGYAFMGAVDGVATELIARTKFNEYTQKGMSEQKAHIETDKWVSKLMSDRSLGQQPLLYNSKFFGLFTKYQLEVRNQLDSMFYDTLQEIKEKYENIESGLEKNARTAAKVTATLFKLAVAQHIFGTAFEAMAGYNPAFDIIEVILTACGFDDEEDSEDTTLDNLEQAFFELLGDMPYSSLITDGGRIPISSALPIQEVIMGKDQNGYDLSREERGLKALEALPYYFLPTGYGQLKKTVQGLSMFDDDLLIAGSYTDSGKLRFSVEETMGEMVRAGFFGQYASKNAQKYFDEERAPLSDKKTQELVDLDIPIAEYWKVQDGLKALGEDAKLAEKIDYIADLEEFDTWQKNIMANNLTDRKDPIDLTGYEDIGDFEEFDYSIKNPGKYAVAKSVGGYDSYMKYSERLNNIKAEKDANGESISGSRKIKVARYINNLDIEYGEKLILYKSEYKSDDTYNYQIIEYLNGRDDISRKEMETILTELDFKVYEDGRVTW